MVIVRLVSVPTVEFDEEASNPKVMGYVYPMLILDFYTSYPCLKVVRMIYPLSTVEIVFLAVIKTSLSSILLDCVRI